MYMYVIEGAKLIIVETWGRGHICHRQERHVAVFVCYYKCTCMFGNGVILCWGATGILGAEGGGGHLTPCDTPD